MTSQSAKRTPIHGLWWDLNCARAWPKWKTLSQQTNHRHPTSISRSIVSISSQHGQKNSKEVKQSSDDEYVLLLSLLVQRCTCNIIFSSQEDTEQRQSLVAWWVNCECKQTNRFSSCGKSTPNVPGKCDTWRAQPSRFARTKKILNNEQPHLSEVNYQLVASACKFRIEKYLWTRNVRWRCFLFSGLVIPTRVWNVVVSVLRLTNERWTVIMKESARTHRTNIANNL